MLSKNTWVASLLGLILIITSFFFNNYDEMKEIDEKVRTYLIQVYKESNESYFLGHHYYNNSDKNNDLESELEALRFFLKKYGRLENILFLDGDLKPWVLEEGELLIANYIVVSNYEKQKNLKYAISFVKVESDLKFYGINLLE